MGTTTKKGEKQNSNSKLGKALDWIGTIIIVLAILVCLSLAVPKLFGVSGYAVITGSMEPTIPVGSMIYAKYEDPHALNVGDVIVFYDGYSEVPVTHRVVENNPTDGILVTQGDANPEPDMAPILYPNVIGKVVCHVPILGRLLAPLGSFGGKLSLICIIMGALLLSMAGKRARRME